MRVQARMSPQALCAFLSGDEVCDDSGWTGRVVQLHEDRTATLEALAGDPKCSRRVLLRDLQLVKPSATGFPHIVTAIGEMELVHYQGKCILRADGNCIKDGARQRHDRQEGVHYMKLLATGKPVPDGCRVVGIALSCEGMDQGWGNTGDSGVEVGFCSGTMQEQDHADAAKLLAVTFDRRQSRNRLHTNKVTCVTHAAPMPGDRLQVWLKCPNYPGWHADCTGAVVTATFERDVIQDRLGIPLSSALSAISSTAPVSSAVEAEMSVPFAALELLWKRLDDDRLLKADPSHLSLSGQQRQGTLADPKHNAATQSKGLQSEQLPAAAPRVAALLSRMDLRAAEPLRGAMRLMERLERGDATAGAPQDLTARSTRYRLLLQAVAHTLDSLEVNSVLAETVFGAYANAEPLCIYRWEREIQMCHDLVCEDSVGLDARPLEDIILDRLHAHRRRLAEAALHRAKGTAGNNDMHFDSYFYGSIHFGVIEQRDALLDPNRLNYAVMGGTGLNPAQIQAELWQDYTPRKIREVVRREVAEARGENAETVRAKLHDWLRAAMPEGFRPRSGSKAERQEAWLFEQCHDDDYAIRDTALNFMLCRMRVFLAEGVADFFEAPSDAQLPCEAVFPGARVRIKALTARQDLNGRTGVVVRPVISAQGGARWEVRLDGQDGAVVSVRDVNLASAAEQATSHEESFDRSGRHFLQWALDLVGLGGCRRRHRNGRG
eukprot:gnl/TRDRNA2_/TRDRNA2_169785_c0_seq2.p1 gnl/TRDRNA2_/TRDRNA2_169785_c0~~gnl/TRDRNA2_/TRDRNA2_169785_c0_seq2.p1  ORF type:complete len:720 (+),score=96.06 gnl/TRDRNA2_/TRDRNA2_169785_c0_seq2:96-2255(+)